MDGLNKVRIKGQVKADGTKARALVFLKTPNGEEAELLGVEEINISLIPGRYIAKMTMSVIAEMEIETEEGKDA